VQAISNGKNFEFSKHIFPVDFYESENGFTAGYTNFSKFRNESFFYGPRTRAILNLYLVAFHAYPSPAYDGSILFWNGTDDLIQITHINQEDDESIEPKETQIRINERIFGRNVHQNISSISLTDQGNPHIAKKKIEKQKCRK